MQAQARRAPSLPSLVPVASPPWLPVPDGVTWAPAPVVLGGPRLGCSGSGCPTGGETRLVSFSVGASGGRPGGTPEGGRGMERTRCSLSRRRGRGPRAPGGPGGLSGGVAGRRPVCCPPPPSPAHLPGTLRAPVRAPSLNSDEVWETPIDTSDHMSFEMKTQISSSSFRMSHWPPADHPSSSAFDTVSRSPAAGRGAGGGAGTGRRPSQWRPCTSPAALNPQAGQDPSGHHVPSGICVGAVLA